MIISGKTNIFLEPNVDTDIIIPARFLKRTSLDGFEPFAFYEKRYLSSTKCEPSLEAKDYVFAEKQLNPGCSLNNPHSQGATFLITWFNFGCGSSREHAVYALRDYKVIIGSSPQGKNAFADIFRDNCRQNLIWTPVLQERDHKRLVEYAEGVIKNEAVTLSIDTDKNLLFTPGREIEMEFEIPEHHKDYILKAGQVSPFAIAKQGIEAQSQEIDKWNQAHSGVIDLYPRSL